MFENRLRGLMAVMVATAAFAGSAQAASTNGLSFRAFGFYKGVANISQDSIACEIPTVSTAIADGGFQMGLSSTYGVPSVSYPDVLNPYGNPCGGWLQLQNNMRTQGISLTRVVIRMKVLGAKRFRDQVPTRNGWPTACKGLQKQVMFLGARMDPMGSPTSGGSGSGQPNTVFVQLFPMLSPQAFACLQNQYGALSSTELTSLAIQFRGTAYGMTDAGDAIQTQLTRYTLTLQTETQ